MKPADTENALAPTDVVSPTRTFYLRPYTRIDICERLWHDAGADLEKGVSA